MRCYACVQYPEPEQGGARMQRPLEDTESCAALSRLASCGLSRTVWSIATATHPPYFVGTLCSICGCCPDARPLQPAAHKTSCLQLLQVCAAFQPVFVCNPKSRPSSLHFAPRWLMCWVGKCTWGLAGQGTLSADPPAPPVCPRRSARRASAPASWPRSAPRWSRCAPRSASSRSWAARRRCTPTSSCSASS